MAVRKAVDSGESLLAVNLSLPEFDNKYGDAYRAASLVELARDVVTDLVKDGDKCRVLVQPMMGVRNFLKSIPMAVRGIDRMIANMDWGDAAEFVEVGSLEKGVITDDVKYYVVLLPTNAPATCVTDLLKEVTESLNPIEQHMILVNPSLQDFPCSTHDGPMMTGRGREGRYRYVNRFRDAYRVELLYYPNQEVPIRGLVRKAYGEPFQLYRRAQNDWKPIGKQEDEWYELVKEY